jgi:hypothetical protein
MTPVGRRYGRYWSDWWDGRRRDDLNNGFAQALLPKSTMAALFVVALVCCRGRGLGLKRGALPAALS